MEKLTTHFSPQVNTTYKVYNSRKAQQNKGESFNSFQTRLRTLAKTCKFADTDKEIKGQIILSCKSNILRRKALHEDLDLTALLKAGRALKLSETQAQDLESTKTTVNAIKHKRKSETHSKKGIGHQQVMQQVTQGVMQVQRIIKMQKLWRCLSSQGLLPC